MSVLDRFHPAVRGWFDSQFAAPTVAQRAAWPAIAAGRDVLIGAPTGSGKTLAAFLAAIDALVRQAAAGRLEAATQVVYVSPLKALSNDVRTNLEQPLAAIDARLATAGLPTGAIRAQVRSGDTPAAARAAMSRTPPHILVTTPESLYLLLTSDSGRRLLATTRSVIVDEIHALAGNKRGAHLALSLERLAALCGRRPQRVGLSATQKPMAAIACFLSGGAQDAPCEIIDAGHVRERDLALLLPDAPLEAVMSAQTWENLYDQLARLIREHRTTLLFANTRRMVERVTRHLGERLGERDVAAHHGSLARQQRHDAEQRLKAGTLRALVATASLELGIDIGEVDLVVQLGTPRSISTLLQRVGRANHAVGGVPVGRLVPLSRDELVECTALLGAVRAGELDTLSIPPGSLDVLSQQLVAEVAAREDCGEDELYALVCRAGPYRTLPRERFDAVVRMLADGISTRRGRQSAYLHRDAVHGRLRARRGARLTAITCGGAIPDTADYRVVLEPPGTFIGTLNEDFAVESLVGDVFQLGNCSYRILRVQAGVVRVEDAHGQPPTLPFWLGEAPARSAELSAAVSALRAEVDAALPVIDQRALAVCRQALIDRYGLAYAAAEQLVDYLASAKALLGHLPTQRQLLAERFFDEAGDMHLVVHAPFGSRINRALGLTLRKRFCRSFNFELQAAATEDAVVLSLGETHSFALEELSRFLGAAGAEAVLVQAVLDAPVFATRWRWNATVALAVRRARGGARTPAPLQRMAAEDLIAVIFPDQLACGENLTGEREIPDHPLVVQTLHDCLHEAMDVEGLTALLAALAHGEVRLLARELPHPSPLAQEILNARPYAYLDDAPLEERRTRAVAARRWLDPQTAAEFGQLSQVAIDTVCAEAMPAPRSADELHDALMLVGVLRGGQEPATSAPLAAAWLELQRQGRATAFASGSGASLWVAAELLPMVRAVYPLGAAQTALAVPSEYASRRWDADEALRELLRGRLQAVGPVSTEALAEVLALPPTRIDAALVALEAEGFVLRGRFTPGRQMLEWCERRLLARIHRYTLKSLRAEIEPVSGAQFMRFLLEWQGVTGEPRLTGAASLERVIGQLEGFALPAAAWEADVLPARLAGYDPAWLDALCLSGRVYWARLQAPPQALAAPVRTTPIALLTRRQRALWQPLAAPAAEGNGGVGAAADAGAGPDASAPRLSAPAAALAAHLRHHGASFFDELRDGTGLLPTQAEQGLAELVAAGLACADSFAGLRALLRPLTHRRRAAARGRRGLAGGLEAAGRWSLLHAPAPAADGPHPLARVEPIAWLLLRRYGVVCRRLLARESAGLPPWHALLRVYRRLEAQGHVRGGRFIAEASGEQYALPEAVTALRAARRRETGSGKLVALSAADPLNIVGILTPGERVPALAGNRLLLRDGIPVAVYVTGEVRWLAELGAAEQWRARSALLLRERGGPRAGAARAG